MSRFQAFGVPLLFSAGYVISILVFSSVFFGEPLYENIATNVIIIMACLAYRRHRHIAARRGAYTIANISLIFVLMVAIWFVAQLVGEVILSYGDASFEGYSAALLSLDPLMLFVVACILGPLAEEYLFRGILYANLRGRINAFVAAAISSLAFAAIHGTLVHIPLCILLGILSCAIYERTHRVRGCFALHAAYNAFGFVAVGIPMIDEIFFAPPVAVLLYLVVLVAVVFVLAKARNENGVKNGQDNEGCASDQQTLHYDA